LGSHAAAGNVVARRDIVAASVRIRGDRLMPGISQRRFYSTIRRPSAEALDILAASSEEISETWNRALRALNLDLNGLLSAPLDFAWFADQLRVSTYPGFRRWIQ